MEFQFLENEFWYGGAVYEGYRQPVGAEDSVEWDFRENPTANQLMPLFLSSKGRYLWSEEGFYICFHQGNISVNGSAKVILEEGFGSLRGAYLAAMKRHFPFHEIKLSDTFIKTPVYNTWIELTFYQAQDKVLEYAQGILDHGLEPGVLMIDDGWSPYYGKWEFRRDNFPEPEKMLKKLHEMGFKVMLWICPFVTPDTIEYRETMNKHLLIETPDGKARVLEWWNGYSAALDLTNPQSMAWLKRQMDELQKMGVDGFKFDAGDPYYYTPGDKMHEDVNTNELSRLWAAFAEQYEFNELRTCFKTGGYSLMQRLCDKHHSWAENGVGGLIPGTLIQGLTGHPFGSPDMIGGGEYLSFWQDYEEKFEPELFIRYCEVAALTPVMQFSAAPWRLLNKEDYQKILKAMEVRRKYLPQILEAFEHSKRTGEPIVRHMEYEFPGEGMEEIMDQFMIGETLLAAPIDKKGVKARNVHLPKGKWKFGEKIIESAEEDFLLEQTDGPIVLEKM